LGVVSAAPAESEADVSDSFVSVLLFPPHDPAVSIIIAAAANAAALVNFFDLDIILSIPLFFYYFAYRVYPA
jgi:hypothetical protein